MRLEGCTESETREQENGESDANPTRYYDCHNNKSRCRRDRGGGRLLNTIESHDRVRETTADATG